MVGEERKLFSSGVTHPSFFCLSLATDGNDVILLQEGSRPDPDHFYLLGFVIVFFFFFFANAKFGTLYNIVFGLVILIFLVHVKGFKSTILVLHMSLSSFLYNMNRIC